jgi:hypothetical protein
MLQNILLSSFFILICLSSCQNPNSTEQTVTQRQHNSEPRLDWTPPSAGEVVDQFEKPIKSQLLHNAVFRVSILATDSSNRGHYLIKAEYGGAIHEVTYKLPAWNDDRILKPWIQPIDSLAYACAIGFNSGNNQFRPYYLLKVVDKQGSMDLKQVKMYMLSR